MRINCVHGYFIFDAQKSGDLSRFVSLYGFEIERSGNLFTFADLVDAPEYSIQGGLYLGAPATKTFQGHPWDVMKENNLVYNFVLGKVVPMVSIVQPISVKTGMNWFLSPGMILPGSVTEDGKRVRDYAAHYNPDASQFRYSEIDYE